MYNDMKLPLGDIKTPVHMAERQEGIHSDTASAILGHRITDDYHFLHCIFLQSGYIVYDPEIKAIMLKTAAI